MPSEYSHLFNSIYIVLDYSHPYVRLHMPTAVRVRTMELHTTWPLPCTYIKERLDITIITSARA